MEELLKLLSDGYSRTIEMLAAELHTTTDDVMRRIDFLERSKIIRRVATSYPKTEALRAAGKSQISSCLEHGSSCSGCSHGGSCSTHSCSACMPDGGFKNMGVMWEVIK